MTLLNPDLLAALTLFAFVSSITPGPNNTMLMASGANFGLRASAPHMAGVTLGFVVLLLAVGLGLGGLFTAFPWLHEVLAAVGVVYLLWLAWKIATSSGLGLKTAGAKPQTFLQAAGFQWVNPKAWVMGLGAMTAYAPPENYIWNVVVVAAVFAVVSVPCVLCWTGFGVGLRRFLDRPATLRTFNLAMAGLLVVSLIPTMVKLFGAG